MTSTPLKITLAGLLALGTATTGLSAQAQDYNDPVYQQQLREYEAQKRDYDARRDAYEANRSTYDANRDSYQASRDAYQDRRTAYEIARDDYERERAEYERSNGYGSWARRYSSYDVWYQANRNRYDDYPTYAANDAYRPYANNPCENRGSDGRTVAGGLIGALAGAALGSNVAARNARTEGAVLGAVVGGALGAGIASSSRNTARCDASGYYYTYDQTVAYREAVSDRGRSGRYDSAYYSRMRCRLAPAPAYLDGRTDYRYVRVCPDRQGRYRITG